LACAASCHLPCSSARLRPPIPSASRFPACVSKVFSRTDARKRSEERKPRPTAYPAPLRIFPPRPSKSDLKAEIALLLAFHFRFRMSIAPGPFLAATRPITMPFMKSLVRAKATRDSTAAETAGERRFLSLQYQHRVGLPRTRGWPSTG
jgi:hypothetical protein